MPECVSLSLLDAWVNQLQSAENRALIELAARQKRRIQVVLSTGDRGKINGAKITAS